MIRLCSSSTTRAHLLQKAGIDFEQSAVAFDEEALCYTAPKAFVYHAALGKLNAALQSYDLSKPLLVADTVITAQNRLLRKAATVEEAKQTLLTISGNKTAIITYTIFYAASIQIFDLSATWYQFNTFDTEALEAYLASNQWQGKAGACMVEGFCKPYIASVHGYESCAMGLTLESFQPYLKAMNV